MNRYTARYLHRAFCNAFFTAMPTGRHLPKNKAPALSRIAVGVVMLASVSLIASAANAQPQNNSKRAATSSGSAKKTGLGSSVRANEPVTLNFANADIEAVARTMATITGRNVVVDPRVKGQITLTTENPVPPSAAFQQFLAALRLQGFTVVESAGLYKVVPEADAKLQGGSVSVSEGGSLRNTPAGGQIVTQIFKLNFESAGNLVAVLRPLISPNNTINVNPGNNSLVITDYADNLQRIAKIIAAMDVSNATDVEIISLQHAVASDLAPLVLRLIEGGSSNNGGGVPGQSDTSFKTTLLAEPRSNALIIRAANPAKVSQIRALVRQLDQPPAPGSGAAQGNIHVVYLKNADATKLATTLRAAMSGMPSSANSTSSGLSSAPSPIGSSSSGLSTSGGIGLGSSSGAGASLGSSSSTGNQPSTGGQIQADPSTNSLIITAPDPQYRQLRTVIDKLDGRRAQVLVESLIVEVNSNKAAEFGIQWQTALGKNGDSNIGLLGTNYSGNSGAGTNIINLATGAVGSVLPSNGLNFGIGHQFNGQYALSFLARFIETTGSGNVLSKPNLLTIDNEEAKIVIGQNVPFLTGQFTNTNSGSSGSVNPFQTIERKDVGLSLRVRPQINENGTVKLSIYQEVSSVLASTKADANGPTTTKRSIESNVLVEDGMVVVLGGLLQDTYVLGNLFRSETRSREKTNLMVFLRPVVLRDADATNQLSVDRYDQIRGLQQTTQPEDRMFLRAVSNANVLPEVARPTPSLATPSVQQMTISPTSAPIAPLP
jgi:general secretion pathway protein D